MIVCVYLCVCVCISARVLKAAVGTTPEQRAADRKRSLQKKAEKARTVGAGLSESMGRTQLLLLGKFEYTGGPTSIANDQTRVR